MTRETIVLLLRSRQGRFGGQGEVEEHDYGIEGMHRGRGHQRLGATLQDVTIRH